MPRNFFKTSLVALSLAFALACTVAAQQPAAEKPLTSQEFVKLLYALPGRPDRRDALVEEIRRRGIDFELTSGLRGLVSTKSGNDALLRRTLEEAARRRANPSAAARPSEAEANEVWGQAQKTSLAAATGLPDFVVKQLVTRQVAREHTQAWRTLDRLTVAVSYRESGAREQYKLIATNGVPEQTAEVESASYEQAGGSTTTGEFASLMLRLFSPESETKFRAVDTDTLRGRRALVYEFEIARERAEQGITYNRERSVKTGLSGRVWIDRELHRVLRAEVTYTEIEPDFPVKSLEKRIDFDWVTISEQKYLLPVAAEAIFTVLQPVTYYDGRSGRRVTEPQIVQYRNEIRFRNYQKFGTEVKIIEDDDFPAEPPPEKQ
jgi:Rod binding domain-containing protein